MKAKIKRLVAATLAAIFVAGLLPADIIPAKAAIGDTTLVYYEDFDYADSSDSATVLSTLGWQARDSQSNYAIKGGRLYCDSISPSATGDSYVTVLDDVAMSEVAKGDYTISYKLIYEAAANYKRYGCILYNYNGYKSYNSVHIRVGGYGNNEVRSAAKWYTYDSNLAATGTSSLSYKLYGIESVSANAANNTDYPLVGKTLTVRIAVDVDTGATVYINGIKVSEPTATYKELFLSTQQYASAIALKIGGGVQMYLDDLMVYTGLGDIPTGVSKGDVSYTRPENTRDKNALKVMTYNILNDYQATDTFANGITRTYHLYNIINGMHPDILGLQERSAANMNGVTAMLLSDGDYATVGDYRTDTSVANVFTYTPIFYNTKRFSLVKNTAGNNNAANGVLLFEKSYNVKDKTPEQIASYSGTKGMSWAVLQDKQTGGYVLALNAHFALTGSSYTNYTEAQAVEARLSNATQAIEKMEAVYATFGIVPTVFTGDFNMRIDDPAYKLLSRYFKDAIYANDDFVKFEYTTSNINVADYVRAPNLPIDHIFYNATALKPTKYYVANKGPEFLVASDHVPVMSVLSYNAVASPSPSHITGIYSQPQLVKLEGAGLVYYTTDGSDPRSSPTRKLYGGAISIARDTTLKASAKLNGVYSDISRVSLFFSNPLYITEVMKNTPGADHTEGLEIINTSIAEVDLADFTLWAYSHADEATLLAATGDNATLQMPMAYKEGDAVLPSGAVAYCPIVYSDSYLIKDQISATESAYLVTLSEDGTKVSYHRDKYAKALSYDGSGNINPNLIFPIDRTARSIGYTEDGVAVRRPDYYNGTDGAINNNSNQFNFGNGNYTKVFITLRTAQSAAQPLCSATLDSTDGGISTTNGTTSVATGSFNFLPTAGADMTTQSFSAVRSIGSLTASQQTAFEALMKVKQSKGTIAISTPEEFGAMTADGSYYLAADISLSAGYPGVFTGSLDGRGHTISSTVPLFEDMSGTVINLKVEGNISSADYNAAITKKVTGNAYFENITVNAKLFGGTTTGAIVGYGVGGAVISIVRCINNGEISGSAQTGGILGYAQGALLIIDECINNGKVYSSSYAAGIVGRFGKNAANMSYVCNISNCENNGEVSTTSLRAAGIIAYTVGNINISGCINYGYIHCEGTVAEFTAGGIYGQGGNTYTSGSTTANTKNALLIKDCYNHGVVESSCVAGGILGKTPAVAPASGYSYVIDSCGNLGSVTVIDSGVARDNKGAGGIAGCFDSTATGGLYRCFNLGDVSNTLRACGLIGYFNSDKLSVKDCYNAGTVSGNTSYQLFYNANTTAGSSNINNNHALAVNGTQEANATTFTAAELANGILRDRINSGAGVKCYFQQVNDQVYPTLREYKGFTLWGIVLKDGADYTDSATQILKVSLNTNCDMFMARFAGTVKVINGKAALSDDDMVGTGYTVSSFDGRQRKIVVVTADIDGDAKLSTTDLLGVKAHLTAGSDLTGVYAKAADVNGDGNIDTADYLSMTVLMKG